MTIFSLILVVFLILTSIVIFMSYSVIMCILWIILESPDLAVTEAAVGAGVTSVLFFVTLKRIHAINTDERRENTSTDNAEEGKEAERS